MKQSDSDKSADNFSLKIFIITWHKQLDASLAGSFINSLMNLKIDSVEILQLVRKILDQ